MPDYILKSPSAVGIVTVGLYYTDRNPEYYGTGWFGDNNIDVGIATVGFATIGVSTISGSKSFYQTSTGKISIPGNQLNTWANNNINIDLSQNMVAIGTIGREPIWNFTNANSQTSRVATVTVVAISASTTPLPMGSTYTVNGGSSRTITWATTSVPNFDITNWNILTFRILNDDVGITSVFAVKG